MSAMKHAVALALLLPAAAGALPPPRYVPAPKGLTYFMLYGGGNGLGQNTSTDAQPVSTLDIPLGAPHHLKSTWNGESADLGLTIGRGLGSLWFLKGSDVSLYLPFYFRDFSPPRYWDDDVAPNDKATHTRTTLHPSLVDGAAGKGLGDAGVSAQVMLWASAEAGFWGSAAAKVFFPTATLRGARQFTKILHGASEEPGGGLGVAQVVPALSVIKMIGGQRLYLDVEYAQPLGKDSFTIRSPAAPLANPPFADSDTSFKESFAARGIVLGTIGLETSLKLWGVSPGLEIGVRQYQAAAWTENGVKPLDPVPYSAVQEMKPNHPPEFLRTAAWTIGGVPLKNNTEIEAGITATWRIHANDVVKAGVSYLTNSFGGYAIGVKISFTNLWVEKTEEEMERAAYGTVHAREVDVAPTLEAPAAPTGRIATGVTFPAFGAGVSQEEADWAGQRLRDGVKRLRGYDLFPAADMAQLGLEACGDAECGTRFGRALKLQAMVVSRLEKTATGFSLTATLVNVAEGTAASSDTIAGATLEEMRKLVPGLLDRLTNPAPAR